MSEIDVMTAEEQRELLIAPFESTAISLLQDSCEDVRIFGLKLAGALGTERTITAIVNRLPVIWGTEQMIAICSLSEHRAVAGPTLIKLIAASNNSTARDGYLQALRDVASAEIVPDILALYRTWVNLWTETPAERRKALNVPSEFHRRTLAEAIGAAGHYGEVEKYKLIMDALSVPAHDPHEKVRVVAAEAMHKIVDSIAPFRLF